ncbi:hypothetical protein D7X55_16520 [Corallococcus sp. AB049A]|nr:hypothetical protein D7X55_16520 [Corallococcus sp. AB049A]
MHSASSGIFPSPYSRSLTTKFASFAHSTNRCSMRATSAASRTFIAAPAVAAALAAWSTHGRNASSPGCV